MTSIDLPFVVEGLVDLSAIGLVVAYSSEDHQVLDITSPFSPRSSRVRLPDALNLKEALSVHTDTFTLYVNVGEYVEVWDFSTIDNIHLVAMLFMDGVAYTPSQRNTPEKDHLTHMVVGNGYLYLFCA